MPVPPVLISDIDGTIAFFAIDSDGKPVHRTSNDFSQANNDIPNQKVISLIKAWYSFTDDPTIYFVTNRDVKWRDVTVRWLVRIFPPSQYKWVIRMRPSSDQFSSAASVKEGFLVDELMKYYDVQQVWEDNPECIAMYKFHDLLVFDAKETW